MSPPQGQGLLEAAAATGDPKLLRLVEKVRGLLVEIRAGFEAVEAKRELRERVARLEAELAEARVQLNGPRRTAPRRPKPVRDADREALIVERYNAGAKPTLLAKELKVGPATVYRVLRAAGVELRGHTR